MIPRVFVSSTYYDLKHVRESLEKFISVYGFEPILFESDKVTYEYGKPIDQSAYYEVALCHVLILIIGGRYGSQSRFTSIAEERRKYNDEYVSITRKELETAIQKNIPVSIFIDKNVYAEFKTYKENHDFFESLENVNSSNTEKNNFKFAHVDDINVFRFIEFVSNNPIKTFEKVEEIESYLKIQFAGMFYLYLESLKKKADDRKILDSVNELNNISLRMNEMLSSVGKQILGNNATEYEKVIDNQFHILLDYFGQEFRDSITFENDFTVEELKEIDLQKITTVIYQHVLKTPVTIPSDISSNYPKFLQLRREKQLDVLLNLNDELQTINEKLVIKNLDIIRLNSTYHSKVKPFIKNDSDDNQVFQKLAILIEIKLSDDLPF